MKMRFFFPLLIIILITAACTGDAGPGTARPTSSTPNAATNAPAAKPPTPSTATAAAAEAAPSPILPILGPAPTWNNDVWINSEIPLPLEELRGKVVLLEFWTFG